MAKKRDYTHSDQWEDSPQQVKNREMRNAARRELARKGKVRKGDGKDVDHKKMLAMGGKNVGSNLRVVTERENRSFPRNPNNTPKNNGKGPIERKSTKRGK